MKNILITFLLIFVFQNLNFAQVEKGVVSIEDAKQVSQKITDDLYKGRTGSAFVKLREVWILPENEIDYLEKKTIEQMNLAEGRIGAIIGQKFISEEVIEDVAVKFIYVLKHEKHLLRLKFMFYKGVGDKWYLNSFSWDDKLSEMFSK